MSTFRIAGVQIDCRLMAPAANLEAIGIGLREAANRGAKLAIFPECFVSGYCFTSKAEAWPYGEPIPGPSTNAIAAFCREVGVHAVVGLMETDGDDLYNVAALIGPDGVVGSYRKTHLPYLGVDRFTTPGNRPYAVHEVDGVRIGMLVCYDSSFPEATRCLMLAGADVIALPTNWPEGALKTAQLVPAARALENHVYFAAVNRVGVERGTKFLGLSSIANPWGDIVATAPLGEPAVIIADVDVSLARQKHIVRVSGEYELHRLNDRRPDLYGPIVQSPTVNVADR